MTRSHTEEGRVMKQVFDLIDTIIESAMDYFGRTGVKPVAVAISRGSYRRLLEIKSWEERIGNLIIGCRPLEEIETPLGKIKIVIDELLVDTSVEIA